jgi:hypothetical protein
MNPTPQYFRGVRAVQTPATTDTARILSYRPSYSKARADQNNSLLAAESSDKQMDKVVGWFPGRGEIRPLTRILRWSHFAECRKKRRKEYLESEVIMGNHGQQRV